MGLLKSIGKAFSSMATLGISNKIFDPDQYSGAYQQADANAAAMKSWNLMNDYNHPIQQMERLKAAGLNPLLVYGSGSVAGNTTGAPSLVGGSVETGSQSIFSGLGKILGAAQGFANVRQANAAANASQASAGASGAQAANLNAQAAYQDIKNNFAEKTMIADLDYKKAQTELAKKQGKVADQTALKVGAEADIAQGEADLFGSIGGAKGASSVAQGAGKAAKILRGIFK